MRVHTVNYTHTRARARVYLHVPTHARRNDTTERRTCARGACDGRRIAARASSSSSRAEALRVAAESAERQCTSTSHAATCCCSMNTIARDGANALRRVAAPLCYYSFIRGRYSRYSRSVVCAKMAMLSREFGAKQQPPFASADIYRAAHSLPFDGSMGMRSTLKYKTWSRRGSCLRRICVDSCVVSPFCLSSAFPTRESTSPSRLNTLIPRRQQ